MYVRVEDNLIKYTVLYKKKIKLEETKIRPFCIQSTTPYYAQLRWA